jgi:hypothetical protein
MREVKKTLSYSLVGKKESAATMTLYLKAMKDGSSDKLSKMADEMRTKLPGWMLSVESSVLQPLKMKRA